MATVTDALGERGALGSSPNDGWVRRWTLAAGIALLVRFLAPDFYPSGAGRLVWPWTKLAGQPLDVLIRYLTPPALGIAALIARAWASPRVLGVVFTAAGAATVVFRFGALGGASSLALPGVESYYVVTEVALLPVLFGVPALVAGSRLRRLHPYGALPRGLPRLGASALLIGLLIPVMNGDPIAQLLVSASGWRHDWALETVLLAVLALGVVGMFPPSRAKPGGLPAVVSLLARVIAVAMPLALILTGYLSEDASWRIAREYAFWTPALIAVEESVSVLAVLVLLAVGLVAWIDAVECAKEGKATARVRDVFA